MPGSSQFYVPWSAFNIDYTTFQSTQWVRAIPAIQGNVQGIADCNALERGTPPTLRTAYNIYAVSLPWAVYVAFAAAGFTGDLLAEIALLINGEVKWIGTDAQPAIPIPGADAYIASGSISADLNNPLRINPRERLSLRLGFATSPAINPVGVLHAEPAVAQTFSVASSNVVTFVPEQGTISYQIIDLPGTRSL